MSLYVESRLGLKNAQGYSPANSGVERGRNPVPSFAIDQASLAKLHKEKNPEMLRNFGGVDGIASALKSDRKSGISENSDGISLRRSTFGSNTLNKSRTKCFFQSIVEAFKNIPVIILLVCGALFGGLGIKDEAWLEGGSILLAGLIIALFSISKYWQKIYFDKLSQVINHVQIEVVRNGIGQRISIVEILVGDLVCLKIGDKVPADGLYLDGNSLEVDELNGNYVDVNEHHPYLFSGTVVVDGYGQMLVTSVGMNTAGRQMTSSLISGETSEQTPLQARLKKLILWTLKGGSAVAFVIFVVLIIRYFSTDDKNGYKRFNRSKTEFRDMLKAFVGILAESITVIVVAIPVGLPFAVNLTLSYIMTKMMAEQATVRRLSACETLGSATVICTDKTGTLTLNHMEVSEFWLGQEPVKEHNYSLVAMDVLGLIREGVALNTTGAVYKPPELLDSAAIVVSGSPTEKAILAWGNKDLNMDMKQLKENCSILRVKVFTSEEKRSGVMIKRKEDGKIHVHWKGAAEIVLNMCSSYYDASGIVNVLDEDAKLQYNKIIEGMASSSLRCIAFAAKEAAAEELKDEIGNRNGLILLGIVGIKNQCRPGVKKSVEACHLAGIEVKMITGDDIFTAKAVATECGILKNDDRRIAQEAEVVEGEEFRKYTPEERLEKVDKICVMARSSPSDKLLMVQCLKRKGHLVVVTGDGTKDAQALKEADIGIAIGIETTQKAMESSAIYIEHNGFPNLAAVLHWGLWIYHHLRKLIQVQLTANVVALVINTTAAVSEGRVLITAFTLFWANLMIFVVYGLTLGAVEEPSEELKERSEIKTPLSDYCKNYKIIGTQLSVMWEAPQVCDVDR